MQDYEIPMVLIGKHVAETTHDDLAAERAARQAEITAATNPYAPKPLLRGRHHKPHGGPNTVHVLRVAWRRIIGHQPMPTEENVA